jgi:hypothetical protein
VGSRTIAGLGVGGKLGEKLKSWSPSIAPEKLQN